MDLHTLPILGQLISLFGKVFNGQITKPKASDGNVTNITINIENLIIGDINTTLDNESKNTS